MCSSGNFCFGKPKRCVILRGWARCLTEAERKLLTQFLPSGTSEEEVVHLLLTGQNYHFGNPLLTWSSSLFHGNLHPDAVLDKEQQIRTDKKTYHEDIHNYHSNMIEILKKWKEIWLTCDNPESLFRHNLATTKHEQGDLQSSGEKISSKASIKEMPMKGVRIGDVSKFMSYIKISRSQHDLVKRMKQSGDGIQTKHLTRVIGDIDNFHVKPYETFVEDEKKRLRNYWAILSRKDLPTAFVARRDRKMLVVNLRKSLYLDLAQKNISIVEKAEQITNIAEEVGRGGVYQNDDISDEYDELVDHSSQDVRQVENDHSTDFEDEDVEDTSDPDASICSHDSQDMKMIDQFALVTTNQTQNSSEERDQDLKNINGTNSGRDSGNSSDKPGEDLEDISYRNAISQIHSCPCVEDEDTKETGCIDTTLQDHNSPDVRAQELKGISHEMQCLNSSNMLVQGLKNTSYSSLPIRSYGTSYEQDDAFRNISYLSASSGRVMNNIPSANSNPQMNGMIVDQKEAGSISMIPSHSTLLFSKPSSEKGNVEGLEKTEAAAKREKDLWQTSNPVDAFYHPPENNLYAQSDGQRLKHNFSGGQTTMIYMGGDVRGQQQAQVNIAAALPSLLQPCTNQQNNQQLQNGAKGTGTVLSFSHGHLNGIGQSVDLHPITNNHLAQSALVVDPLPGQMHFLDQRHNGLYLQQLKNNVYSGAGLSSQETFPMVERQGFGTNTPTDQSCNWFPNEDLSHNNWSAMESDGIEAQDLPGGSSADGSLFSVLSQYKQASSRMQLGASSSNQSLETRSLVWPAQNVVDDTAPPAPNIYGYTQNLPRSASSHVASADASLNNLQWANMAQESSGMPDPSFGQFQGPWSR